MRAAEVRVRIKGTQLYLNAAADPAFTARPALDYNAAGMGRRLSTWFTTGSGPNAALLSSLNVLRDRSRDAVRKNVYAASVIETIVSNTVGAAGVNPQCIAPDETFRKAAHQLWWDWSDEADADWRLDLYGLQSLVMRSVATAGEVFVRFRVRRPSDGLSVPLQLQLLEAEHCPIDRNVILDDGNRVQAGIEFNNWGQRVAYWMYPRHPGESVTNTAPGVVNELVRVPAEDILHIFLPLRPGQLRGEPWLTRALIKIKDLEDYDDAELMRKKVAAAFVGFVERPDEALPTTFGETAVDDVDEAAAGVTAAVIEPGTLLDLKPGEKITLAEATDVGGQYEVFMKQQARMIATATGTLYEELTGDYSQGNDRTLRAALNAFQRRCEMWQHHVLAFSFCRPVWNRWVDMGVFAGALKRPARIADRDLRRVKWQPQPWRYLHPVQDVEAQVATIRAGLATRSQMVSERGYDAQQLDEENKADNDRADALGLKYDSDGRQTKSGKGAASAGPQQQDQSQQ